MGCEFLDAPQPLRIRLSVTPDWRFPHVRAVCCFHDKGTYNRTPTDYTHSLLSLQCLDSFLPHQPQDMTVNAMMNGFASLLAWAYCPTMSMKNTIRATHPIALQLAEDVVVVGAG